MPGNFCVCLGMRFGVCSIGDLEIIRVKSDFFQETIHTLDAFACWILVLEEPDSLFIRSELSTGFMTEHEKLAQVTELKT